MYETRANDNHPAHSIAAEIIVDMIERLDRSARDTTLREATSRASGANAGLPNTDFFSGRVEAALAVGSIRASRSR